MPLQLQSAWEIYARSASTFASRRARDCVTREESARSRRATESDFIKLKTDCDVITSHRDTHNLQSRARECGAILTWQTPRAISASEIATRAPTTIFQSQRRTTICHVSTSTLQQRECGAILTWQRRAPLISASEMHGNASLLLVLWQSRVLSQRAILRGDCELKLCNKL